MNDTKDAVGTQPDPGIMKKRTVKKLATIALVAAVAVAALTILLTRL